jgi:hypothetical protein
MIHSILFKSVPCIEVVMGNHDLDLTLHAFGKDNGVGLSFAKSLGPAASPNPYPLVMINMRTISDIECLEGLLAELKAYMMKSNKE